MSRNRQRYDRVNAGAARRAAPAARRSPTPADTAAHPLGVRRDESFGLVLDRHFDNPLTRCRSHQVGFPQWVGQHTTHYRKCDSAGPPPALSGRKIDRRTPPFGPSDTLQDSQKATGANSAREGWCMFRESTNLQRKRFAGPAIGATFRPGPVEYIGPLTSLLRIGSRSHFEWPQGANTDSTKVPGPCGAIQGTKIKELSFLVTILEIWCSILSGKQPVAASSVPLLIDN